MFKLITYHFTLFQSAGRSWTVRREATVSLCCLPPTRRETKQFGPSWRSSSESSYCRKGWTGGPAGSFALFKVTKRWLATAWILAICRGENWARTSPPVRVAGRGRGSSSRNGVNVEKTKFTPRGGKQTTWEKSLLRRPAAPKMKQHNTTMLKSGDPSS